MLRLVFLILTCFFYYSGISQFFFQDIITAGNSSKNYLQLKKNLVKKVNVTSIEPDGSETEDFAITQSLGSGNKLTTVTTSGITGTSILITEFNSAGLPVMIEDSSASTITNVNYAYDNTGKLLSVKSHSHQPEDTNNYTIREDHLFQYNASGQLEKMLKVKDNYDTMTVVFIPAENGLPGEEQWFKKNRKTETWYYYYDDKNRLTDIVRYNTTANKMLPDYVFEYDENGNISQQTVVQAGTNFYRLWLYEYDEKGLKKAETIFRKGKEQEGRIIYSYE